MYTPHSLNPALQTCTTPCQFDMWKNADVHRWDVTPHNPCQSNLVLQNPTMPCQFDMWKNADIPRSNACPPLIEPSFTEPYYTMSVWYVVKWTCTQVRCDTTPPPPLIKPSATEPYYTMPVWHVEECRHTQVRCTPSTNWTQCYRTVLHHVSLIYRRMQIYPGQM